VNLTGRPPYQKGAKTKKNNAPTKAQRERWSRIIKLGCIVEGCPHKPSIHHALTGAGGRKNHDKVLPLCYDHHQGDKGIHTLSRRVWEPIYGSEESLLARVDELLRNQSKLRE